MAEKTNDDVKPVAAKSIDPAAIEMLAHADACGLETVFHRADDMKPCPIGEKGACCRICSMGPCRLVGKDAEEKTGLCGADLPTIAARHFARQVAGGASAHSDHGRDMAMTLRAVALDEAAGYKVKDEQKLMSVAGYMGIATEGRPVNEIALDVADTALAQFGQPHGEIIYTQARHAEAPEAVARARHHPSRHRPRGRRDPAPHARGRRPRRREHPQVLAALLAGRRLGRLAAQHRHERHPLRHAVAALVRGQPRRAQGRPGQRHRPRPRADALGDARRGGTRPGARRRGQGGRRGGHQPRRHLLHQQRDPHALRHPGGRQLPAPGAGRAHRRRGGHGRRRAVHHAGAGAALPALPHAARHHLAQGQDPGREARGVRRAPRPRDGPRDRAHGDRQLPEPRSHPHPGLPRAAGRRVQPRVPQLHAGRVPPRLVPPAQRRDHRRARSAASPASWAATTPASRRTRASSR